MRTYEHRIYTLASEEALHAYETVYYPKHQVSMPELFGVTVHGYWRATGPEAFQFHVLLSYPEGVDPAVSRQQYREHPQSAANMPGFDPSVIVGVSVSILEPAESSPMQ